MDASWEEGGSRRRRQHSSDKSVSNSSDEDRRRGRETSKRDEAKDDEIDREKRSKHGNEDEGQQRKESESEGKQVDRRRKSTRDDQNEEEGRERRWSNRGYDRRQPRGFMQGREPRLGSGADAGDRLDGGGNLLHLTDDPLPRELGAPKCLIGVYADTDVISRAISSSPGAGGDAVNQGSCRSLRFMLAWRMRDRLVLITLVNKAELIQYYSPRLVCQLPLCTYFSSDVVDVVEEALQHDRSIRQVYRDAYCYVTACFHSQGNSLGRQTVFLTGDRGFKYTLNKNDTLHALLRERGVRPMRILRSSKWCFAWKYGELETAETTRDSDDDEGDDYWTL